MHLRPFSLALLFLCFLTAFTSAGNDPTHLNGDVSINCGASGISGARNGREWHGDSQPECSPLLQMKGFSTASSVVRGLMAGDDPVPYRTARISRSRFSYAFRVKPGQKIIRLHFNSVPYKGFQRFEDLFDVEAGAFTLLGNFSASLTADALGVGSFVKEFCVNIEESQLLNLIFSPASGRLLDSTYAFINGIEIIFVPPTRSYFHGEKTGVQVVGKSSVYLDKNTAFEIVNPLNVRQDSVSSSVNYVSDMSGTWGTVPKRKANMINNITWRVSVDVGFRYLVRLYFSELGFKMAEAGGLEVHINDMLASTSVDIFRERDDSITWYRDYTVMMEGNKQEGKIDLRIYLESTDEFREGEGHGPLEGFEVMKLSNPDNSLASPNPVPKPRDSSYQTIKNLIPTLGHRNAIVSSAVAVLCLVNIVIYTLPQIWEASGADEENMPSARAERLCRRFSLAEIELATRNFNDGCLIGRGGFGKVYKGFLHDGQQHVAIKRLKSNSSQGVREFLTEIETLTELQHVNVVSLIGYCKERREMILVYEFMARGTLADHLYKFVWNNDKGPSLTWKQRLNICIGVGRGLDYLHTGRLLIHRDVKASNILLDEDFVPKLSDFGLVTHLTKGKLQSYVSTKIKGTRGYLDPDYVTTGRVTRKSDIYAFGVVLLEVLSGRPALNSGVPTDEQILTKWAKETISEGKAEQILASNLRGKISVESLKAFLDVVVSCVQDEPKKRPTMATVVLQLEFALEQQESSKSRLVPNGITSHVDDIHPSNSETNALVSDKQLTLHSTYVQKIQSALKGQTNGKVFSVVSPRGRKNGRKTTNKPPRLWPWAACWTRKKSKALQISIFSTLIKPKDLVFLENEDGLVSLQLIGRGGCGEVYKAALPGSNGTEIAIKKIIRPPRDVMEEHSTLLNRKMRQIRSEILTVGQIRHRNLLHLLAHVPRPDKHCLVYTYMKNGSLLDCLEHVACGRRELDWLARYKIAVGVAAGLEYLHVDCVPPIVHRDLKPSNILLDDEMEARIADFGLAKSVPDANTEVPTSNVVGTVGYIAPEYYQTFKFTVKCDVYGLGVVLGALVIGKVPSDDLFQHTDEKGLVKWMRNVMNSEEPKRAIDPTLLGNGYEDQMLLVLKVACFCTLDNPKKRPSSKEARSMLSQIRH